MIHLGIGTDLLNRCTETIRIFLLCDVLKPLGERLIKESNICTFQSIIEDIQYVINHC